MKFLFSRDVRDNSFLKSLLLFWFLMLLTFIIFNFLFEMSRFGLTPAQIKTSILGDASLFIEAKDLASLLTEIHTQLFIYSLAFIMSLSIFVHLRIALRFKSAVVWILAIAILLDSISVLGVRFLSPAFAYLKALSFVTIEGNLLLLSAILITWLLKAPYASKA
jgi:hypothetical protein